MKETKELGTESRSNFQLSEKVDLDILEIMQQCGIDAERWKNYITVQSK